MDFLHQQAERGDLDVTYLSKYILNMMVLLCAPVRDEAVQKLESITDPVRLLRWDTCGLSPNLLQGLSWQGLADSGTAVVLLSFCWRQLDARLLSGLLVFTFPKWTFGSSLA